MPKKMRKRAYHNKEDRTIIEGIGTRSWAWFLRELPGRSIDGIRARARRIADTSSFKRGVYSLHRLSEETGYALSQLRRAQSALGQKWRRLGPRGDYIISEEQVEELVAWLAHDYWSRTTRRYVCAWCASDSRKAKGLGLCTVCYYRYRRLIPSLLLPKSIDGQKQLLLRLLTHNKGFCQAALARLNLGIALSQGQLLTVARLCEMDDVDD